MPIKFWNDKNDKKFKNTWDMYLAYCRGGFLNERISVSQYLLENK